jgi:hypothetical protein
LIAASCGQRNMIVSRGQIAMAAAFGSIAYVDAHPQRSRFRLHRGMIAAGAYARYA